MDFLLHLPSQLREHLRALRKARGLTQAALGLLLGVGQARIAEIESNPGAVSVDQMMKLLSALQASLVLRDGASGAVPPAGKAKRIAASPLAKASALRAGAQTVPIRKARVSAPPQATRHMVIRAKKGSW